MAESSHGLLGRIQRANDDASRRFGPNTAEVEAFIQAAAHLTPWQWRQVLAARRLVALVTKEHIGQPGESLRSIQEAIRSSEGRLSEPMARAGEALFEALEKKSDEKVVSAWQAVSALVLRHQLSALKFAAHYAPFAALVPVSDEDALDPAIRRFLVAIEGLSGERCEMLAKPWRLEHAASRALLQAVAKKRHQNIEEAVALGALAAIPAYLTGDAGWAAVRTAVHGGRVLSRRLDLSTEEFAVLWAPLQEAIPHESLDKNGGDKAKRTLVRAAVTKAIESIKPPKAAPARPPKAPALFGPNSGEVAAFVKAVVQLTPIQWLRVQDRRQLVASVTREGSSEPAGVVRALLAAIEGTKELDTFTRCRAFAAVERASFAVEAKDRATHDQLVHQYRPFAELIALEGLTSDEFAKRLATLNADDWAQVATSIPSVNEGVVAPLVNSGTALLDFLSRRSDGEAVATWHAVSALVRRHHLTPIKFAASYAPFASAIPATSARARGAMVLRYLTAIGRLGGSQCEVLAQPWQLSDEISNALSQAMKDGSARPAEEAAALAAMVTVPMRLSGSPGWAAVKTAAFGGRVIASRARLTLEQIEALWKPLQPAIPLASLGAPVKTRR
jgi:DNA-binding NarL/FixJ family response regulator